LVDVTKIDKRVTLLGREFEHPILISPVSNHINVNPYGEVATARGAGKAKATMIVSTFSSIPLEDIAKAATQPLWHATYLKKDRNEVRDILQRVEKAGYEAICIPVDTPVIAARDREHRSIKQPVSFFDYPVDYYSSKIFRNGFIMPQPVIFLLALFFR
jgi:4-hydroxymandelate oxidase